MEQIATLPPVIGLQLVEELHAAGIPAETTDMPPGVGAAVYPGLLEATLTVWVRDADDAVRARAVLEEMQASFSEAEAFDDDDDDDPSGDEADPSRPDPSQVSRRRRVAHLAVLLLWLGPPAIIIMLGLLLVSLFAVGGVG